MTGHRKWRNWLIWFVLGYSEHTWFYSVVWVSRVECKNSEGKRLYIMSRATVQFRPHHKTVSGSRSCGTLIKKSFPDGSLIEYASQRLPHRKVLFLFSPKFSFKLFAFLLNLFHKHFFTICYIHWWLSLQISIYYCLFVKLWHALLNCKNSIWSGDNVESLHQKIY